MYGAIHYPNDIKRELDAAYSINIGKLLSVSLLYLSPVNNGVLFSEAQLK